METHSEFAANKFLTKEGRIRHNQLWNDLQETLNALSNAPGKTTKQWQTVSIYTNVHTHNYILYVYTYNSI